jgi:hypothetical protein
VTATALPVFDAVRPFLSRLALDNPPGLDALNALGAPVRFVPSSDSDEPYELHVERTREVPTRPDNWHDVFNALAWCAFPQTKRVLNHRHGEEIRRRGATGARGTVRDALSLFDEGGVIVASDDASLLELLRGFEWKALFWTRRADVVARMRFFVFGHAILEKAMSPYKGITAKALLLEMPPSFLAQSSDRQRAEVDARAAAWFAHSPLDSTRLLSPLPILGVPGWGENDRADFYEDTSVFRPGYRGGAAGAEG